MPFRVIHPSKFAEEFCLRKVPSRATLKRWRDLEGFPSSLEIPRGHYRYDEVERWFQSRNTRAAA